jgi:HEAT repeat protein
LTTRRSGFLRVVRPLDELVASYRKHLSDRVNKASVFGTNEDFALQKVFVDLTILENRARPASNLQYRILMDAEPRGRRRSLRGGIARADGRSLGKDHTGPAVRHSLNLDNLLRHHSRAIIAGSPGSGKSTLLRYLASRAAQNDRRLPIFIELKDITSQDLEQAKWRLEQLLLDKVVASVALSVPEREKLQDYIRSRLAAGETIILLDGLDEVSGEEFFNDLCRAIQRFSLDTHSNQLIVSTRPYALRARFDHLPEMEIAPFGLRQIERFLEHHYGRTTEVRSLVLKLQQPHLRDLASVPLLLAMLAHLYFQGHPLASDRSELYRQIVRHLTNTLDQEKMVDRFHVPDPEGAYKRGLLHQLAYAHLCTPGRTRRPLTGESIAEVAKQFCRSEGLPIEQAFWLASDVKATPLLHEVYADAWTFVHPTLQEYLAASALTKRADCAKVFSQAYFDPVMTETELLPMALGLLSDDNSSLFGKLDRLPDSLTLAGLRLRIRSARYGVGFSDGFWETLTKRLTELVSGSRPEETFYLNFVLESFAGLQSDRLRHVAASIIPQLDGATESTRKNAATAVGWLGGSEAVASLCETLQDATGPLLWTIHEALARIGGGQALECALGVLNRGDEAQRHAAAITIGYIGDERAVTDLAQCLNDQSFLVRWAAVEALGRIGGNNAMLALVDALRDGHANVREAAILSLGTRGSDEIEQALLSILNDDHSAAYPAHIRKAAVEALGYIGGERALTAVLGALEDHDPDLHFSAVQALGEIGDELAAGGLIHAMAQCGLQVAILAAEELGHLGGRKALDALLQSLRPGDGQGRELVRAAAAEALGHIRGDEAFAAILEALRSDTVTVRSRAINGLRLIGGETAVVELIASLGDDEMLVRWRAVEALGQLGGNNAVSALLGTLKNDDNMYIRWNAAKALGEIGDKGARTGLVEASREDPEDYVRAWANAALDQLEGRPARADMLAGMSGKDIERVMSSATALAAQQTRPENVGELLALVHDSDTRRRESAPEILARLDQETLSSGLLIALHHNRDCVRARAVELIGYYRRDGSVLDELRRLIVEDAADEVREAAEIALERINFAIASSELGQ